MEKIDHSRAIADLEQQIAKIQTALHKARVQQQLKAEKALASAQKAAALAQTRLDNLILKGATTPAAKTRLAAAKTSLRHSSQALASAEATLAEIAKKQKSTAKIAKKTNKLLAKASKGKTAKSQKKLEKKARKAAKKLTEDKASAEVSRDLETQPHSDSPAPAAKKRPVAKPAVKRAPRKAPAKPATVAPAAPVTEPAKPIAVDEPEPAQETSEVVQDKDFLDVARVAEPGVEQLNSDSDA